MKKYLFLVIFSIFLIGCAKPEHHPNNPNYSIEKPKIIYNKANKDNLKKMVKKLEGSPYVWAEEGPNNFDCSGYTYYMYGSMGITIPRVAREQAKIGKKISIKNLSYGDLIFFDTTKRRTGKITHVGMYLGNGWFTHASTKKYEVVYSRLNKAYYKNRLKICRRYLPTDKITTPVWKNTIDLDKDKVRMTSMAKSHKLFDLSGVYIQVGSYKYEPNKDIINKIKKLNLKYQVIKFPKDGIKINKVLVGPYKSKKDSSKILFKIRKNITFDAFFVKID